MNNDVVSCSRLRVSYGQHRALDIEHLGIHQDDGVIGLCGPNGAGKSTLIRVIVGDIATFDGEVNSPQRADIAYLPDEPFLYSWLTVQQCEALAASRHSDFRSDVFNAFLADSNIDSSMRVGELSKGMNERLHVALIVSRVPKLYVLDEPLGGVDPVARDHLLALIQALRAPDVPMLVSTHLINTVGAALNNIMVINNGRLLDYQDVDDFVRLGEGDMEQAYKRIVVGE